MASASVTDILQLLSSHADKKIDACNQVFADQMEWSAATVARIKEDFAVAVYVPVVHSYSTAQHV